MLHGQFVNQTQTCAITLVFVPCLSSLCLLHRLDSLVQSQARELSQLRQQIKESRRLGALQRRQLEELSKAFKELLQASEVDYYMGEVVKEQLDKSLSLLDRLEGRLDKGRCCCLHGICICCLLRNVANQNHTAQT